MLSIIFEFVGGPNDGKTLRGALGDGSDAERYYFFTNHGAVGQRLKVASDFAVETLANEQLREEAPHHFHRHYYMVTDREETGDEVTIRAQYIEKKPADALAARPPEQPAAQEGREAKLGRFIDSAARSMSESYSHWWPAHPPLAMHLGHVLLNERFTLFTEAGHSDPARRSIDLVGIAASQDWFVACRLSSFDHNDGDLLAADLHDLQTFWLSERLTIPPFRQHVARVAEHCAAGYGIWAGLVWQRSAGELHNPLAPLCQAAGIAADCPPPRVLGQFAGEGSCHLAHALFALPRP